VTAQAAGGSTTPQPEVSRPENAASALRITPVVITLELDSNRRRLNPFLGSALRGALGHAFQASTCVTGTRVCRPCTEHFRCPYAYVFETSWGPGITDPTKRFTNPPRPYVISVPFPYDGADTFELGLTLVGHAHSLLPQLLEALHHAGERGVGSATPTRFRVDNVRPGLQFNRDGASTTLERVTLSDLATRNDGDVAELELEWLTPLRIKRFGGYLRDPERLTFSAFFDVLLARIEALAAFHCGGDWNPDRDLRALADQVTITRREMRLQRLQRFSSRKRTTHPIDGLLGQMTVSGPLARLLPYLRMGTLIHLGNGADFGLGRYRIHIASAVGPSDREGPPRLQTMPPAPHTRTIS